MIGDELSNFEYWAVFVVALLIFSVLVYFGG
jgi:hypothetical protein